MIQKVVVLLPEGKLFDRLFAEAIAPNLPHAERLQSEFSSQNKLGVICNAIHNADLVVADLTGRNPCILYQVGFAHGVGKRVLFLAQHLEDFPFDQDKHVVIGYAGDREFLRTELSEYLQNGKVSRAEADTPEDARARFDSIFGDILKAHKHAHRGEVQMENATTFVLLNQDMDLALVQNLARKARELGFRLKLM